MDLAALGVDVPPADTPVDVDVTTEETPTADEGGLEDNVEGDSPEGEAVEGEEAAPEKTPNPEDGRKIPAKYRELFKQDKELRALYFQAQEFKRHFENPAKAAEMLDQLSALGGFEGISATQAEFAEIDKMFATGDKGVLEKFLSKPDNQAGFAKLGPALLDEFRKVDEPAWTHEVAKVMASTLAQAGVGQDINTLAVMLKDSPDALAIVKKIAGLVGGIDKLAQEMPKPKVDPEREKFLKEKADFERSKSELFLQEINNGIGVHIEKGIKDSLAPYIKNRKLDPESYSLIEANVGGELTKLMNADPAFTAQKDAVLKSGDKARIQKFFTSRITKHLPDATKRVMRAFGMANGSAPASKEPAPATPAMPAGVMRLNGPPKAEDIDYRKSRDILLDGKAYLKSGKLVQWV